MASKLAELANEVTEPPVRLVKTIGDAAMFVSPEARPLVSTALSLLEAVQAADLPEPAGRGGLRHRAAARRRLLRPRRQPGQPGDRRGAPRQRALHPGGARRRARRVRLVVRPQAQAEGHVRRGPAVPRPPVEPDPEDAEAAEAPEDAKPPRPQRPARPAKPAEKPKKKSKADRRRTRAAS